MKSIEFCFWLQGFYELTPSARLHATQVECVLNHLNLVDKCQSHGEQVAFTSWLRGALEVHKLVGKNKELPLHVNLAIQKKLAECFQHDIDPIYEKDGQAKEELNKVHRPPSDDWEDPGEGVVFRC